MVEHYKPAFSGGFTETRSLEASWPRGVISLSHVALPFPPDDPLYGAERPDDSGQLYLGQLAIRGERGLMLLSSDWLLRLRHNPFYAMQEKRIIDWVAAAPILRAVMIRRHISCSTTRRITSTAFIP